MSLENTGNSEPGENCAAHVGAVSSDLAEVIAAWPLLDEQGRGEVLAIVRAAAPVGADKL